MGNSSFTSLLFQHKRVLDGFREVGGKKKLECWLKNHSFKSKLCSVFGKAKLLCLLMLEGEKS